MANSNTEHSKKLRSITAAKWAKKNSLPVRFYLNGTNPKHVDAANIIESMPQKTNVDKLLYLVELYKKHG